MAITALSRPTVLPSYVDPIDPDGLTKIMMYRQQAHDQGKIQTQSRIDAYRNSVTELVRESDRKYLQDKIDSFVSETNDKYAQANFGDISTLNSLSAGLSVISKDEKVQGAMKDSRAINSLLQNYQKLKTDPKLMDRYSKANEDWDMNFVTKYMSDPNSRYYGSSTPTPFVDIDKKLEAGMNKLKADMMTKLGPNGYMTYIKSVGPERIRSLVMNKLASNPQYSTQLGINQAYKYKNVPDSAIVTEFNQKYQQKFDGLKAQEKELKSRMNLAKGADEIKVLQDQIDFIQGKQKEVNKARVGANVASMKNDLYMTDLVDGYVSQFSFREEQMKSDPTYIANMNMQQRQYEFNTKIKMQDRDYQFKSYYAAERLGIEREKLGIQKDIAAARLAKLSGESTGKGGAIVNPLETGYDTTAEKPTQLFEVEEEIRGLQNTNKQVLAKAVMEVMFDNNPELRSQRASIERLIGGSITNAEQTYNKVLNSDGVSLDFKNALRKKGNALFRHIDKVALGLAPASDIRGMSNPIISQHMQELNHNFQGALALQRKLKDTESRSWGALGITEERLQTVNKQAEQYRKNFNSIPEQYITMAASRLGIGGEAFGIDFGLGKARQNPVMQRKLAEEAAKLYKETQLGISPSSLRQQMQKDLPNIALSRKSFTFPSKIEDDVQNSLTAAVIKLAPESRGALDNSLVSPLEFTQNRDGSYNLKYRTSYKDDNGRTVYDKGIKSVSIPAGQSRVIEQFLPKNWGQQTPLPYYQQAINETGGLYMGDNKTVMGLYSEGNLPIPYSLQKYGGSTDPEDNRVQVILNRRVGAGTRWVDAPQLGIYPNAASAVEAMNSLGQSAYSKGFRNVQDFINKTLNTR